MTALPTETRVVIVGGGIAGASVAYYLTKLGCRDVVLLEQNKLGGGTTWHAAGMVGRLRTTNSMTRINQASAALYAGLEQETGHSVGWKQVGSVIVGKSADRMTQLHRTCAMAELMGVEAQIISADEARTRWPLLRTDDLLGAAWLPHDGKVIPKEVPIALAKAAVQRGARVFENVRVLDVLHRDGRAIGVRIAEAAREDARPTDRDRTSNVTHHASGTTTSPSRELRAEFVVLTGGMWTRELGLRCGVSLPLYPVEHHYVVTEPIAGAFDELPLGRDPDLCIYFRGEGNAIMLGAFQKFTKPWLVERIPDDFSFKLLEPDWEKYQEPLAAGRWRIPALAKCGFAKFVNGPESFTPDNNWLMGETPELRNLFVLAGFNSIGIASSGGAGAYLAEWILEGQPTMDLWSVDIRRFGPWANNRAFLRERVTETLGLHYRMAWPNREFETGRGLRKSPLHDRLAAQGACFGVKNGWERPNWFAVSAPSPLSRAKPREKHSYFPERAGVRGPRRQTPLTPTLSPRPTRGEGGDVGRELALGSLTAAGRSSLSPSEGERAGVRGETVPTQPLATTPEVHYGFARQNWFPNHAAEHRAARENVAVFDQTGFSKFIFKGRDVVKVLQRLCGNNVDVPVGRAVYTGLFNERGGFESDLTLTRAGPAEFSIISGSAQTVRDFDWITRNLRPGEHAELLDVTNAFSILSRATTRSTHCASRKDIGPGALNYRRTTRRWKLASNLQSTGKRSFSDERRF